MLTKRIVPCLDVRDGRTVKGVQFEQLRDAGDPVELAQRYADEGADELVLLDITATIEGRSTFLTVVEHVAAAINIPFTVGGGVSTAEEVRDLLLAGADKVSINSAAIARPELIRELASHFGSQCVVVAIDTRWNGAQWKVYARGGRVETELRTLEWAREVVRLGAGEILLTSMNNDGEQQGFAVEHTASVVQSVQVPVIASGGAGEPRHFEAVLREGGADAALAASVFHFGTITILDLKRYLDSCGVPVRL
jgi:imidazole glycerol-phosphate synthase subunit HisF